MAGDDRHRPDDIAYLTALVRAHDRPRYYATLFAPAATRADLMALYGFAAEVARVPGLVSEPQLGEIRLLWWQESLATAAHAPEAGESPALRALAATVSAHALPLAAFDRLVEATASDLYSDPPATRGDLEGKLGETESALFQMAAIVMGASGPDTAEAAGHAGVAYGLARRLATFAADRARGRSVLPSETLSARSVGPEDVFVASPPAEVHDAIKEMIALARNHLEKARRAVAQVPQSARPAFLPLAIVDPLLRALERAPDAVASRPAAPSDLQALLRIGWARMIGL